MKGFKIFQNLSILYFVPLSVYGAYTGFTSSFIEIEKEKSQKQRQINEFSNENSNITHEIFSMSHTLSTSIFSGVFTGICVPVVAPGFLLRKYYQSQNKL